MEQTHTPPHHLNGSWFRIAYSAELEQTIHRPFYARVAEIPDKVLLCNEEPFAYLDMPEQHAKATLWLPGLPEADPIHFSARREAMAHHILTPAFDRIDQFQLNEQQAAGLIFACAYLCRSVSDNHWVAQHDFNVLKECEDTYATLMQLSQALLNHDQPTIDEIRSQYTSGVIALKRPNKIQMKPSNTVSEAQADVIPLKRHRRELGE